MDPASETYSRGILGSESSVSINASLTSCSHSSILPVHAFLQTSAHPRMLLECGLCCCVTLYRLVDMFFKG